MGLKTKKDPRDSLVQDPRVLWEFIDRLLPCILLSPIPRHRHIGSSACPECGRMAMRLYYMGSGSSCPIGAGSVNLVCPRTAVELQHAYKTLKATLNLSRTIQGILRYQMHDDDPHPLNCWPQDDLHSDQHSDPRLGQNSDPEVGIYRSHND